MKFANINDLQNRSLIVEVKAPVYKKDEYGEKTNEVKGCYLSVQIDQSLFPPDKVRTGEKKVDSNPYLASSERRHPQGGTYVSHDAYYSKSQYDAIVAAAGNNRYKTPDNKFILGIKANIVPVMSNDNKKILIINTKLPMGPTANRFFNGDTLEKAKLVNQAAKAYNKELAALYNQNQMATEMSQPQINEFENDNSFPMYG